MVSLAAWLLHAGTEDLMRAISYESEVAGLDFVGGDDELGSLQARAGLYLSLGLACLVGGLTPLIVARKKAASMTIEA